MESVIDDDYGMRGKSRWISEAIQSLLKLGNYVNYIKNEAVISPKLGKHQTIKIPADTYKLIDEAITAVKKEQPRLEGLQSRIIRTSIMQRLLRKGV